MLLLFFLLLGCAGPRQAQLTAYDQICLPGEPISLQAKLETKDCFHFDVKNEKIGFYQGEKKLGQALTNKQGRAQIKYQPNQEGFLKLEARLESQKYQAPSAPLLVRMANPDSPFLIVDIDNTISDLSPILMLFWENADIPPVPGAPETLQRLSQDYTIVYLTGRDDVLAPKTKAWLAANGFPQGPVFFWDFLRTPLSKQKYKNEVLQTLGRKFQLIQIGIGNSVSDAFAYTANGLQSFILLGKEEKKRAQKLSRGVRVVNSWQEIQQFLFAN